MTLVIETVQEPTDELRQALLRLLPQLSSSATELGLEELRQVVRAENTTLFVARQDDKIVGTLALVLFRIPSGVRAWIEDVIVDEASRGGGVGEALTVAALSHARHHGVRTVDLTSRPSRESANRLYERLGFLQRETNVYRYSLEP